MRNISFGSVICLSLLQKSCRSKLGLMLLFVGGVCGVICSCSSGSCSTLMCGILSSGVKSSGLCASLTVDCGKFCPCCGGLSLGKSICGLLSSSESFTADSSASVGPRTLPRSGILGNLSNAVLEDLTA